MVASASYSVPIYCLESSGESGFKYETQGLGTVDGGLGALLFQLGYLSNIWEKVCATRRSSIARERPGVTGSGSLDFLKEDIKFGRRCSGAEIEILKYPSSTDCEFDGPGIIYVGKCGFFRGGKELDGENPRTGISVSGEISLGLGARPGANPGLLPARPNWGDQKSTGMTPLAWGYDQPPVSAIGGRIGVSVQRVIKAGTSINITDNYNFPLRYINFKHSAFQADRADCTGFWWQLKPGVQANIVVYGNELYHPVSFSGGGEGGGQGNFNPLTCGTLGPQME